MKNQNLSEEFRRMQELAGIKQNNNSNIELNTSFLQSQDDFERAGDEGYTIWKPEFKNGLKQPNKILNHRANQQSQFKE